MFLWPLPLFSRQQIFFVYFAEKSSFVATRTNLIPSHSRKPLMEAVVNHSLKRSLETQNVNNIQTERTQIFTARGSEGTITLILPLVTNKATCMLVSLDPPSLCFPFSLLPSSLLCFSDYCDCLTLWFLYHVSIPVFWVKYVPVIVSALQGQ